MIRPRQQKIWPKIKIDEDRDSFIDPDPNPNPNRSPPLIDSDCDSDCDADSPRAAWRGALGGFQGLEFSSKLWKKRTIIVFTSARYAIPIFPNRTESYSDPDCQP
jgi:hypothetical protein